MWNSRCWLFNSLGGLVGSSHHADWVIIIILLIEDELSLMNIINCKNNYLWHNNIVIWILNHCLYPSWPNMSHMEGRHFWTWLTCWFHNRYDPLPRFTPIALNLPTSTLLYGHMTSNRNQILYFTPIHCKRPVILVGWLLYSVVVPYHYNIQCHTP